MMDKPYSQACENNKRPILEVLKAYFIAGQILEIGSGTGQHAVHFAKHLPELFWQTSDQAQYHPGINLWLDDYHDTNLGRPLTLNVDQPDWPVSRADGIFSANTAHIMHWPSVVNMFQKGADILTPGGYFCLYGPVNIAGEFTSESNQAFDQSLRNRDPGMGIRNLEDLQSLAKAGQLDYVTKHSMPANNFTMVWRKKDN